MSLARVQVDAERVRASLERVLAREGLPEPPPRPGLLERWLREVLGGVEAGDAAFAALLLVPVIAVVAWISWRLASALVARRAHSAAGGGAGQGDRRRRQVAALLERARAAESAGELGGALRAYLFALVAGLGERGDLDFRAGWTNRELLERGRPRDDLRASLVALFDELDPKTFGRVPVDEGDVRRVARLCERWLAGSSA